MGRASLHPGAANSSALAPLAWSDRSRPTRAAPSEPVSTWIWPAFGRQVCIPTLSKLLGGQKGNPHTEAFHSHDLACCLLSPSCLKFLLELVCCNPLDWASSVYQDHYPALGRYSPNIWMRQLFLLALGTRVRVWRQLASGHTAVRTARVGSPRLVPATPCSSRIARRRGEAVAEGALEAERLL